MQISAAPHVSQLEIVYHMMDILVSTPDIESNFQRVVSEGLDYIVKSLEAEAASLFLLSEDGENLVCHACAGPINVKGLTVKKTSGIVGNVVMTDKTRFIPDCAADPDFNVNVDKNTGFVSKSMLCAPVSGGGRKYGAIQIINRKTNNGKFTEEDAQLFTILAQSSAMALSNMEMTKKMVEADKLRRDLETAAKVQASLFPQSAVPHAYGRNIPRYGVSGDLYDYVMRGDKLYFCMGDVSGKGINAALVMSKTHSLFRSLSRNTDSPAALLATINRELVETATQGMFVTMIAGIYDATTDCLQISNAGHEPGLILTPQEAPAYLPATAQPLGITDIPKADLVETQINLKGGRFFAYSDGLTEAMMDGTAIGTEKLADLVAASGSGTLKDQVHDTIQSIHDRADTIHDDLTLLGIGQ